MFRFAFIAFAFLALGAVLAGGIEGAGFLVLAPFFIIGKVFLIMLFFGAISGFFWRGYGRGPRRPPWAREDRPRRDEDTSKTREELFEEWHRVSHAREEVDGWVEDLD